MTLKCCGLAEKMWPCGAVVVSRQGIAIRPVLPVWSRPTTWAAILTACVALLAYGRYLYVNGGVKTGHLAA